MTIAPGYFSGIRVMISSNAVGPPVDEPMPTINRAAMFGMGRGVATSGMYVVMGKAGAGGKMGVGGGTGVGDGPGVGGGGVGRGD